MVERIYPDSKASAPIVCAQIVQEARGGDHPVLQDRAIRGWPLLIRLTLLGVALGGAYLCQIPLERDWPGEPFLLFLLVVIGTTHCFGTRLGVISVALSTFLSLYFFEPAGSPALRYPSDLEKILLYAILALGTVFGFAYLEDTTKRKQAEALLKEFETGLAERNAQLALAARAVLVGSYRYDVNKGTMQVSEGYAAIHGLPEGTTEASYSEWRTRVHPTDLARAEELRDQAFADRRKEDNAEYRIVLSTGEIRWIERRGSISYSEDGRPERVVGVNIDVTERKRAEQHQRALNAELDHRVKNSLATIGAIVSHTLNASSSMADFATALEGRVQSMARTHELLSASRWHGISVEELVRRELAPYATSGNAEIKGPDVILKAEAGQVMGMVLHELATNAAKYGALSTEEGRVSVRWHRRLNEHPPRLVLEWREIGGPSVVAPEDSGFGTSIIRESISYELGGTADLAFAPAGVHCRMELPAGWLSDNGEPASEAMPYSFQRTWNARP
jgi:PAS domain S-box-containing protein